MAQKNIDNNLDMENKDSHNSNFTELYKLKKILNDLVLDAGESNPEVVQARGGEDTLGDRLDEIEDGTSGVHKELDKLEEKTDRKLENKASLNDLDKYTQESEDSLEKKLKEVEDTIDDLIGNVGFKGAMLELKDNITTTSDEYKNVEWDGTVYNESGFWSSSNPSRLVIPEGVKKVRLSVSGIWEGSGDGHRVFQVRKNKSYVKGGIYLNYRRRGTSTNAATSAPIEVEEGDYFELRVQQTSGDDLDFRADPYTYLAVEVVEYRKK